MDNLQKTTALTLCSGVSSLSLIHSFEEYVNWYFVNFDFSMFEPEEIKAVLYEDQPAHYPCIPIKIEDYHVFNVIYLDESLAHQIADSFK